MTTFYYGIHTVRSLLSRRSQLIEKLWVGERTDLKIQDLVTIATTQHIQIENVTRQQLTQLTQSEHHQNVAVTCNALPQYHESDLLDLLPAGNTLILLLDSVQDPHNLGACLRSAEGAGVDFVIIPKNNSASITPVVRKVACGAAEWIPVISVTNLVRTMEVLKAQGIWLWGAAGEASTSIYETAIGKRAGVVLGAEGDGLRRLTREHCDGLMHIPLYGAVNSLNVSVACGICLFEAKRQQTTIL